MTARDELVNALARRYAVGSRQEKTRILDEFVAITSFHRKHAMWTCTVKVESYLPT